LPNIFSYELSLFIGLGLMSGLFGIRFFTNIAATFIAVSMFVLFMVIATLWQRVMFTARD
jgi:hypothetical protein